MAHKLGKLAPKFHPRTLQLSKYLNTDSLPPVDERVYREYKTPPEAKLMFGNDVYGDCVWAMSANYIILATVHTGSIVIPTLEQVLQGYSDVTGFDPTTGANDNGTNMTDALDYLRTTGLAGHKILAWAQVDPTNLLHRKLGAQIFGATLVGVQLPNSAEEQFNNGQPWEVVPSNAGIAGGHAILRLGYGSLGDDYATWAKWDQKSSADWSSHYVDEEYILVSEMWLDQATGKTPGGLNLDALWADIKLLGA